MHSEIIFLSDVVIAAVLIFWNDFVYFILYECGYCLNNLKKNLQNSGAWKNSIPIFT